MIKEFLEGETYSNPKMDKDVMVYGIGVTSDSSVTLAVGFIDRESEEMTSTGELTVKKSEYSEWELVQI